MKNLLIATAVTLLVSIPSLAQTDKKAMKLADEVAEAFSNKQLDELDLANLLRGRRLPVSIENQIGDPEFESRTFKNFWAMEKALELEENEPGFPVRTSGMRVSCKSGLCTLNLKDGQMMHNHVYLTRIWYGYDKKGIYVKRIRILYG